MTALEQPSRDRQRPRRRGRRAWPVVLAVVAAGALLFAFGVAFGMALHDDPEPGARSLLRTLTPLPQTTASTP